MEWPRDWNLTAWAFAVSTASFVVSALVGGTTLYLARLRSAKLRVEDVAPFSYGALRERKTPQNGYPADRLMLRIPIVFRNLGAKAGTIENLQLTCPADWWPSKASEYVISLHDSPWMAWDGVGAKGLEDAEPDPFAHPMPLDGGTTAAVICRFRAWVKPALPVGTWPVELRIRVKGRWTTAQTVRPAHHS